jgi:mannitol/fructose-specific phosphotransferase system IIA component
MLDTIKQIAAILETITIPFGHAGKAQEVISLLQKIYNVLSDENKENKEQVKEES